MPRPLLDRCRPDCVAEFRAAARERFRDAEELAARGRRTGAVYLWGYAAEMTLKAAYFRFQNFGPLRTIALSDLRGATATAPALGFTWSGNLHNVELWAKLLVAARVATPGAAYARPWGRTVYGHAQRIQQVWSETLRYHKNVAYPYEVAAVRTAAEWLLRNSARL